MALSFNGNTSIESFDELQYFENIVSLQSKFFYGCTSLKSVVLPSNLTSIGLQCFYGCTSLESIVIPAKVQLTSADSGIFQGCTKLASITINAPITLIPASFARQTAIESIIIPDTVTEIGSQAFNGCSNLTSITIPSACKNIGNNAFFSCSKLAEIRLMSDTLVNLGTGIVNQPANKFKVPSELLAGYQSAYSSYTFETL